MKKNFAIKLLSLLIAFLISIQAYSQPSPNVDWIRDTISGQSNAMKVDNSGNVYITGRTYVGSGYNDVDIMTVKYDSSGVQQWAVSYNDTGSIYDEGLSIDVDNQGNVYVAGIVNKDNDTWAADYSDYCTIKYNSAGVQQWVKVYSGNAQGRDIPFKVAVDGSGNVYVTGQSYIDALKSDDIVTIKYDAGGTQLWLTAHDGNGTVPEQDAGRDLALDSLSNVYVFGHSTRTTTWYDLCLIKYNSSGVQQFIAYYAGPDNTTTEYGVALALDNTGNIYCIGELSDYNMAVLKYSPSGTLMWDYTYQTAVIDHAEDIAVDGTGNVYFCGSTGATGFIAKLNNSGSLQWDKIITGTGGNEIVNDILLDNAGDIYLTGQVASGSYFDFVTEKVNSAGTTQWRATHNGTGNYSDYGNAIAADASGNTYVTGLSNVGGWNNMCTIKYASGPMGIADYTSDYSILLFPNPASDFLTITDLPGGSRVKILDAGGKVVYASEGITGKTAIISTAEFQNGIYFIKAEYNGSFVNGKFVVSR